jgi:hypothetical protein
MFRMDVCVYDPVCFFIEGAGFSWSFNRVVGI